MAFRSIASLSLSFGLVSIPVKVYSATESSAAIRFKLLSRQGERVRRRYVADDAEPAAVSEADAERQRAPPSFPASAAKAARATTSTAAPLPSKRGGRPPAQPELDLAPEIGAEPEPLAEPDRLPLRAAPRRGDALASSDLVKAYEFEKGRFVTFTAAELKALAESSRPTIDIVSFVPEGSVDPIYYDKAYYLAPDGKQSRPYSLLHAAMRESGRSALAKWAWRAKEYVVQIRPAGNGLVLQQLLYADEVRPIDELRIELEPVGRAELDLALRLIAQIAEDSYDPHRFVDEEKQRILAAVERKIAGRKVLATPMTAAAPMPSAQVIDLVAALRASLGEAAASRSRRAAKRAVKEPPATAAAVAPAPSAPRRRGRQSAR